MRIESSIKGWFAVVAVSVSAVSCDMLDITQDNKLSVSNMWKTAEQVEGSTYGIYSELRSNFVQSQINVFYWGELRVGEYMWGPSSLFNVWVGREVIQNTMTANITSCGWSKLYSAIDQANAVLKYAPDTAIPMTDAKRNWAMGQAYFARAYAYFWAARLWGDVPLNLAADRIGRPARDLPRACAESRRLCADRLRHRIGAGALRRARIGQVSGYEDGRADAQSGVLSLDVLRPEGRRRLPGRCPRMRSKRSASPRRCCATTTARFSTAWPTTRSLRRTARRWSSPSTTTRPNPRRAVTAGISPFPKPTWPRVIRAIPCRSTRRSGLDYGEGFLAKLRDSRDNRGDTRVKYNLGEGDYGADGGRLTFCRKFLGDMSAGKMVLDADLIYYRAALAVMMDAELKYYRKDYGGALESLNIIAKRAYGKDDYYTDASQEAVLEALVDEYFLEFPAEGVIWWALIRLDKIWDYNDYLAANRNQHEHPSVADLEIRAGQELESHADRGLVLIHI